MKTTIKSLTEAIDMIAFKKTNYNIVSIRSTMYPPIMYEDFDTFKDCYNDIIVETFDDIIEPRKGLLMAQGAQIKRILQWSHGKNNILVHCTAGICRSSAIAYLIECMDKPPIEAIKILDKNKHYPNEWVVQLGGQLLRNPQILPRIQEFNVISEAEVKQLIADNKI